MTPVGLAAGDVDGPVAFGATPGAASGSAGVRATAGAGVTVGPDAGALDGDSAGCASGSASGSGAWPWVASSAMARAMSCRIAGSSCGTAGAGEGESGMVERAMGPSAAEPLPGVGAGGGGTAGFPPVMSSSPGV